jgi:hypothetical protein
VHATEREHTGTHRRGQRGTACITIKQVLPGVILTLCASAGELVKLTMPSMERAKRNKRTIGFSYPETPAPS